MAFDQDGLTIAFSSGKGPRVIAYFSATDSLATIRTNAYFDSVSDVGWVTGDLMMISASDGFGINTLTITSGDVALSTEVLTSA